MGQDNFWVSYGPYLAVMMSIGCFIVWKFGDQLVNSLRKRPKSQLEWYPELERAYMAIVHKNRELLETVAEAEELKKQLPPEYQSILDQVIMLARLVENASFEQAQANGVVPKAWMGGPSTEQPVFVQPPEPPSGVGTQLEPVHAVPTNVVALPGIASEWIRSQVLRKLSA